MLGTILLPFRHLSFDYSWIDAVPPRVGPLLSGPRGQTRFFGTPGSDKVFSGPPGSQTENQKPCLTPGPPLCKRGRWQSNGEPKTLSDPGSPLVQKGKMA